MRKKTPPIDLEKSLQELENLVVRLEQGELSLEDALKHFEQGVALTSACQQALSEAEQKVALLSGGQLQPFAPDSESDDDGAQ